MKVHYISFYFDRFPIFTPLLENLSKLTLPKKRHEYLLESGFNTQDLITCPSLLKTVSYMVHFVGTSLYKLLFVFQIRTTSLYTNLRDFFVTRLVYSGPFPKLRYDSTTFQEPYRIYILTVLDY